MLGKGSRKWLREYVHEHKGVTLRPQHVQRAYEFHQVRVLDYGQNQVYTVDVHNALSDLILFCVNDFEKLRSKSRSILLDSVKRWPQSIDFTITSMCNVLNNSDSSSESVTGALDVMKDYSVVTWVTRKYHRLQQWIESVCVNSQQHQDDKVQLLIQQVFTAYYPNISPISISMPAVNTELLDKLIPQSMLTNNQLTQQHVDKRNSLIKHNSDSMLNTYKHTVEYLLSESSASASASHWRYSLMCSAVLYAIMNSQHFTHTILQQQYNQIAIFYAQSLASEFIPLRRIGLTVLCKILALHSDSKLSIQYNQSNNIPADNVTAVQHVTPIANHSELSSLKLNDYSFSGWLPGNEAQVRHVSTQYSTNDSTIQINGVLPSNKSVWSAPHGLGLTDATLQFIGTIIRDNIVSIIDFIVSNHSTLQHDDSKQGAAGAGESISNLVYRHCGNISSWPFTRISNESKALDPTHISLIRAIVQIYPDMIDANGVIEKQLHRIISVGNEQDKQCSSAEIIAGIIMGVRNWPIKQQHDVLQRCTEWLNVALNTQADSVSHYTDALRYAITNTDPRRLSIINKYIIELALGNTPLNTNTVSSISTVPPSTQYKRLKFLLPFIIEYSTRSAELSAYILKHIQQQNLLYHPYKQIREQIGWLLHALYINLSKLQLSDQQSSTTLTYAYTRDQTAQQFINYSIDELNKYNHIYNDNVSNNNNNSTPLSIMNGDVDQSTDSTHSKLLIETVLYWVMRTVVTSSVIWFVPLYRLLPYILQAQRHTDIEIQAIAKAASNLLSFAPLPFIQLQSIDGTQTVVQPAIVLINELIDSMHNNSNNWRYKVSVLKFLQILIPRHSISIAQNPSCMQRLQSTLCDTLLLDHAIEVREECGKTLSNYLISTRIDVVNDSTQNHDDDITMYGDVSYVKQLHLSSNEIQLCDKFNKLFKTNKNKSDWVIRRHAGVLGISSIILIYPHTLPSEVPQLLYQLSSAVNGPMPIGGVAKQLFIDFVRTHTDEWPLFKTQFTEEQLDAVNQVSAAPTYFA